MKSGLVLEGGAMRGLFTAGVIDAFLENFLRILMHFRWLFSNFSAVWLQSRIVGK